MAHDYPILVDATPYLEAVEGHKSEEVLNHSLIGHVLHRKVHNHHQHDVYMRNIGAGKHSKKIHL